MSGLFPPRLSIVIPTHNTRDLTLRCLDTVAASVSGTGAEAQVVLVDDAGTDGTAEAVAERHPAVEVIRTAAPSGFTRSVNLGLSRARGEILLLLNSDTEVDRAGLEALLAAFDADPGLGVAGATLHYPDGSPQWSGGRAPSLAWLFALASGLPALLGRLPFYRRVKPPGSAPGEIEWVTGAALAMRRAVHEAVGPLDESFRFYAQDLDLCLRARGAGWTVALLPDFRVMHHHGATIGSRSGAREKSGGRQSWQLLWSDLLLWARKHRGAGWARRAALLMAIGGSARLLCRGLVGERNRALRGAVRAVFGRLFRP